MICKTCLERVITKDEKPEDFYGRASYDYYCECCDNYLTVNSVALSATIDYNGKISFVKPE
jgi:hypothetical protein